MIKILRKFKRLITAAAQTRLQSHPDILCAKKRFGTDYGGWDVATAGIDSHSVVYSFGVGEDASFDTGLIDTFGLTVHAFDPTPKSIAWVRSQGFGERFILHEYGIAAFDGEAHFTPPDNPEHVSHTILDRTSTKEIAIPVPVKRLATIMKELGHDHITILKMDIEGAEYDVINDILVSGIRPHQILVEFHHRFPEVGIKKTKKSIQVIKSCGYRLFSASPALEEFCFILPAPFRPDGAPAAFK